jgi:hypothetical protein
MNLILTMAGRYSRFTNEGYKFPKYLLPWGKNSILYEIIIHLNKGDAFKNIYLIANKRDMIYMSHVRSIIRSLGKPVDSLFLISDTKGQAETAYLAIKKITERHGEISGPILFHNIDTILYNRNFSNLPEIMLDYDGYIDVFKSNNHAYSYVLSDKNIVKSIAEKVLISDNATSGLYGFSNSDKFLNCYDEKDLYISDIYKRMLDNGDNIVIGEISDENQTIVLGTPTEYLNSSYILDL